MIFYEKIDETGLRFSGGLVYQDSHPQIEFDSVLIDDPSYIDTPIPNNIYVSEEYPPRWTGTKWIETGTAPEPQPQEPSLEEPLEALELLELERMFADG